MNVSYSNGFTPSEFGDGGSCLVGDWKIQFTGVFPLFNTTDAALDSKNDLATFQNAFSTKGLIFIQFLKS
jgi:hypothetical protein